MNLDQAQKLVMQLGLHLGGDETTYQMNDQGEAFFMFEDSVRVVIKHHINALVIACVVAEAVSDEDPSLFSMVMDYQHQGLNTVGAVISWDVHADTLVLSRMLHGEPEVADLERDLNLLLSTAQIVRDDIETIIDSIFDEETESSGEDSDSKVVPAEMIRA